MKKMEYKNIGKTKFTNKIVTTYDVYIGIIYEDKVEAVFYNLTKGKIVKKTKVKHIRSCYKFIKSNIEKLKKFKISKTSHKCYSFQKICTKCRLTKNRKEFYKVKNYVKSKCRKCLKEKRNTNSFKNKKAKYEKNKRKTDELYRIKNNLRNRINQFLKNSNYNKNKGLKEIIGLEFSDFFNHLREEFKKDYNIELKEEYYPFLDLDHKNPLSLAKNVEDVYELNNYKNLRLLYWKHNLEKSDKTDYIVKDFPKKPKKKVK